MDAMCNVNQTFGTEESWTDHKKDNCEQQCTQQHALNKESKKFSKRREDAVLKEMTQSHNRGCFVPIKVEDMTPEEKQQVQMALTHSTEKRDKTIKGQMVHTGKLTGEWLS